MVDGSSNRDNSYEQLYKHNIGIRRYPETDVVAFTAGLKSPKVLVDLGAGTGRNIVPLLCAVQKDGIVIATDIAASGLEVISHWAQSLGAKQLYYEKLIEKEQILLNDRGVNAKNYDLYRIDRHEKVAFLGPSALFAPPVTCTSNSGNAAILALGQMDMTDLEYEPGSIEAIVNRGSIFYLPTKRIDDAMSNMYKVLCKGGKLLLTLKSTEDSRYLDETPLNGSMWRRVQANGDQKGLQMDFYDKKRALETVKDFNIIKMQHLLSKDILTGKQYSDWSFILEK